MDDESSLDAPIELGWRGQAAARFSSPLGTSDVAVGTWKRDGATVILNLETALAFSDNRLNNVSVRGDTMEADYAGLHVESKRAATSLSPSK